MLLSQIRPADQQVHPARVAGEVDRGLAGGIAAADQRHLGAGAQPRLDRRGPVPDAAPLEALDVGDRRPAVARAAGDHDGARRRPRRRRPARAGSGPGAEADQLGHRRREDDLGAELLGLDEGAAGQRLAGDAGREAQVVLDPGAGAGLPAEAAGVEHHHRQALGGGVDRRRQAGRAGADDGHVEELAPGAPADQPEARGRDRRSTG